jgi:hypothetical protein
VFQGGIQMEAEKEVETEEVCFNLLFQDLLQLKQKPKLKQLMRSQIPINCFRIYTICNGRASIKACAQRCKLRFGWVQISSG